MMRMKETVRNEDVDGDLLDHMFDVEMQKRGMDLDNEIERSEETI